MLSAVRTGGVVRRMALGMRGTLKTALASGPDQESISLGAGHVGLLVRPEAMGGLWPRSGIGLRHAPQDRRNSW